MYDMFELFRQAQGGAAFDNLARAYGMSPEQMRAATAALTPAFAQGLFRQSQSPDGARQFAEMFQTETYARAFDAQAAALDPSTRGAGEDALGAMFGSKEVSRAVAAQAAAASGVQAQIIRQVLPVLASILIGGVMKAAQGGAPMGGGGPFGQGFGGSNPGATGPANPFQTWIDAFSGGARPADAPPAGVSNPMGDMMGEWMKTMFGGAAGTNADATRESESKRAEPKQAEPGGQNPFDDMLETGQAISRQNAEAMGQIFDAFFSGGAKPKG